MDVSTVADVAVAQATTQASSMITEIVTIIITAIFAAISLYLKNFLQTNKKAIEYNLNNEKTERILANAIAYAQAKAIDAANNKITKMSHAKEYIESVAPDLIEKEGVKLDKMLERKEMQIK